MSERRFSIRFWGVRGSIPTPGLDTVRYGGNTPCVEMHVDDQRLVFDAGTGLRVLGQQLVRQHPTTLHLLFSHAHWDHVVGFPFFAPNFVEGNRINIYAGLFADGRRIKQLLRDMMQPPFFPVPIQQADAELIFHDIDPGEQIRIGEVTLKTAPLNHPGGALGYRVEWAGRSAAYVTDTEHFSDRLDDNVLFLSEQADILIIDCTYTDDEYNGDPGHRGWGHSTWQEAVKIAKAAGVKRLLIFHHDPAHDDAFMDAVMEQALTQFPGALVAREGMRIELAP